MKEALAQAKVQPLVDRLRRPRSSRRRGRAARRRWTTRRSSPQAIPTSRWRMPDGRMGRDLAQLHLGHDRQPEGRGLHHRGAALMCYANVLAAEHGQASGLSVDAADVPLQRLVLSLDAVGRGRHARLPALGAAESDVRRHRRPRGDPPVRRADRHVDAAQRQAGGEAAAAADGRLHHRGRAAARGRARGMADGGFQRHASLWPDRDLRPGRRQRMARASGTRSTAAEQRRARRHGRACAMPRSKA